MQFGKRRASVVAAAVMALCTATGAYLAVPAFAAPPKVAADPNAPLVAGTPCTATARSCVDLDSQRAWLLDNGKITRGPVKISSGGNGKATPIGHSLRVYRKDKDHKSAESKLPNGQPAPMPWSVFFEDGGIAFHSGSPSRSSGGCIHLGPADAQAWFNYLEIGDQVQVVKASQELPKHKGQPTVDPKVGTGDHHEDGDDNDDDDSDDSDDDD
ncbi:L,D-transpeptidase [Pseudonocardia spinosispora]|uniref:L,D-transpeptidase n=1 Tax=Pseudonocardia spinosispora TaxID=103441 RepID=UPI00042222DA|nr:L,D-transpeptidase [Pseudonocardia spinosispora]